MRQNAIPDAATVDSLTLDLGATLLEYGRLLMKRYPESVDAYALCSALLEIRELFDQQATPLSESRAIDDALLDTVRELISAGCLQRIEVPATSVVRSIVLGLSSLRKW